MPSPWSEFFKQDPVRFKNVETFVGGWHAPRATSDLFGFCEDNGELKETMRRIVSENMHGQVGLDDDAWVVDIAGADSRLASMEVEVCADFTAMEALRREYFEQGRDSWVGRIGRRMKTIAEETVAQLPFPKGRHSEVRISGGCRRARCPVH